jgi:deoxyribonuclease-1
MKTRNLILLLLGLALWTASACSRSPQRNYLDSLRSYWQGVYPNGGETLYCGKKFRPFDRGVNVEHVYPMSWVTKKLHCGKRDQCRHNSARFNLIESDMHNMYAARKDVNQTRSSMAFGMIKGEKHYYKNCDFEVDFRRHRVEPRPEVRGQVARAMLYMADEYGLDIYKKQRRMLEKWNRQYPPGTEEKHHNKAVARIQGKSNPYIK